MTLLKSARILPGAFVFGAFQRGPVLIRWGKDGYFVECQPKIRPMDTDVPGVFLAGSCQGLKDIPYSVTQASGAAAQAAALLSQKTWAVEPIVAAARYVNLFAVIVRLMLRTSMGKVWQKLQRVCVEVVAFVLLHVLRMR